MKNPCGLCTPFSVDYDAEMVLPASPHKVNVVENLATGGAKQLEVILEKDEDNDKHDETVGTIEERDDISEQAGVKKPFVETSPASPTFSFSGLIGIKDHKELHKELDFDINPSELYLLLQRRDWSGAMQRLQICPDEAYHWISRKEADGKLRWRLLPIHGAIIFCAPDTMIKCLLEAYPDSVSAPDDQGMLPLHLCYRMGSPESVIEVLLSAFPESLEVKDRKGRTPIVMAQTAKGPNRAVFLRTIERAQQLSPKAVTTSAPSKFVPSLVSAAVPSVVPPSPMACAAAPTPLSPPATTSPSVEVAVELALARQHAQFESHIQVMQKEHMDSMAAIKKEAEQTKLELEEEVTVLKADLDGAEEASQVLSEHVATLERRLKQEEETETHLATKIAQLDASLKAAVKEKAEMEAALLSERDDLSNKKIVLETSLEVYKGDKEHLEQILSEMKAQCEKDYKDLEKKYTKQTKELEGLRRDYEGVSSNVHILEEQLTKKIVQEQKLVQQVSSLASQLSATAEDNEKATNSFTQGIRGLKQEREDLRATVAELSKKLIKVVGVLEEMSQKQEEIASKTVSQEKEILETASIHSQILSEIKSQHELYKKAKQERSQVIEIMRQQECALAQSEEERAKMVHEVEAHAWKIELSVQTRHEILDGATFLKNQIQKVISTVTSDLPCDMNNFDSDDDNFVDRVIKTMITKHDHNEGETKDSEPEEESEGEVLQAGDETYTLYVPRIRFNHPREDTPGEVEIKEPKDGMKPEYDVVLSPGGVPTEETFQDEKKEEELTSSL